MHKYREKKNVDVTNWIINTLQCFKMKGLFFEAISYY
jgi:hypothetical protein